jgi:hypothetical protein
MGEDYEIWWPLADDQSCMMFCYAALAYYGGCFGKYLVWRRRRFVTLGRLAPWGLPGLCLVTTAAYQGLQPPARTFVWSLGTNGQLLPPYPDEDES